MAYEDVHILPENDLARKISNFDDSYNEPEHDDGIREEANGVIITSATGNPNKGFGTEPNGGERGLEVYLETDEEPVLNLFRTTVGTSQNNRTGCEGIPA